MITYKDISSSCRRKNYTCKIFNWIPFDVRKSREKIHIAISFTSIFNETIKRFATYVLYLIVNKYSYLHDLFWITIWQMRHWTWIWLPRKKHFPKQNISLQVYKKILTASSNFYLSVSIVKNEFIIVRDQMDKTKALKNVFSCYDL